MEIGTDSKWIVGSTGVYSGSPGEEWRRIGAFDFSINVVLRLEATLVAGANCGLWLIDPIEGGWTQLHDETLTEVLAIAKYSGHPGVITGSPYGVATGRVSDYDAVRWTFHSDELRVNERFTNCIVPLHEGSGHLVGTEAGVIVLSSDRWQRTSLAGFPVRTIIEIDGKYYAGSDGRGLFQSSDGLSWRVAGKGRIDGAVLSLAFDGERIVAGTERGVISGDTTGSWYRSGPSVLVAAVGADDHGRWLIGCHPSGLWWTDDSGKSYIQLGEFNTVSSILAPLATIQ